MQSTGQLQTRPKLPPEKVIRSYWVDSVWEVKGFDSPEEFLEEGLCFACGMYDGGTLERAHIYPRSIGAPNDASNLHMLCHRCHKNSEYKYGFDYFDWFLTRTNIDMFISEAVTQGFSMQDYIFKFRALPVDDNAFDLFKIPKVKPRITSKLASEILRLKKLDSLFLQREIRLGQLLE